MNCASCQTYIEDDSRFCKNCGEPVSPPASAPPPAASQPIAQPAAPSPAAALQPAAQQAPEPEREVWSGRPSARAQIGAWALWLLGTIAVLWASARWGDAAGNVRFTARILIFAGAVVVLVRQALVVYGVYYRLTTQRLFIHRGVISRVTDQVELMRVDDVRLRQRLIDRIMNTGDLDIISSDATDKDLTLRSIAAPAEVAEALRANVTRLRAKKTLFVENV
jgi:uncharacterized membrane protein YdbT with pleckstrin-like domain